MFLILSICSCSRTVLSRNRMHNYLHFYKVELRQPIVNYFKSIMKKKFKKIDELFRNITVGETDFRGPLLFFGHTETNIRRMLYKYIKTERLLYNSYCYTLDGPIIHQFPFVFRRCKSVVTTRVSDENTGCLNGRYSII